MTSLILLSRLRSAYWPKWCSLIRLSAIRRARPISTYLDENDPRRRAGDRIDEDGHVCSVNRYDLGRIRYFMDRPEAIDPIEVDTEWDLDYTPYRPLGPAIDDGHHRYMAAVFLRRRRIPARFCGPVELGEWLVGDRRLWPL